MPAPETSSRVSRSRPCREDVLPAPGESGVVILAPNRKRQLDAAIAILDGEPMPLLNATQVLTHWRRQTFRQHGYTVLGALAVADNDLPELELHVLDTEPQRLQKPESGSV
jgi:hypothetical protein